MAHKTLIGGTAYEIKGGRILAGGTAYSVAGGRTIVNGTGYDISFGVTWKKYNCDVTTKKDKYIETTQNIGKTSTIQNGEPKISEQEWQKSTFYTGYTFSQTDGYKGTGAVRLNDPDSVGYYEINSSSQVWKVTSVVYVKEDTTYRYHNVTSELVAECTGGSTYTYYNKGSTLYGEITVDEGALPEDGTILKGSATGSYCVVKVGSTTYYYEKVA